MLSNKLYNVLKYVAIIGLPTLNTLWITLSSIWGLPLSEEVSLTIAALNAALGGLLGVSSYKYNKDK